MNSRANYATLAAQAMEILFQQEHYLRQQFESSRTLSVPLWYLIKLRASQINQCAFCLDMHTKEAIQNGESPSRIIGLSAWRDSDNYNDIERCALNWVEYITHCEPIDDQSYQSAAQLLGEQALVDLTLAANAINSWNRIGKTFKPPISR